MKMIILLCAIFIQKTIAHNEDEFENRCVSCNQFGMTYCADPPDFNIAGYCADTPRHCKNVNML